MPEKVLFESESSQQRGDVAATLRAIAGKLESGEPITLKADGESVTLEPPARPTFEVKAEREGPADGPGELSVEFELEWPEDADGGDEGDGSLEIE